MRLTCKRIWPARLKTVLHYLLSLPMSRHLGCSIRPHPILYCIGWMAISIGIANLTVLPTFLRITPVMPLEMMPLSIDRLQIPMSQCGSALPVLPPKQPGSRISRLNWSDKTSQVSHNVYENQRSARCGRNASQDKPVKSGFDDR